MTERDNDLSDEDLARKTQAGSMLAFEELVYRYENRIFEFIRCRVRGVHDAQDLTQRVFVRAYQKICKFNSRYRFATWLFTIARRESISHFRRVASKGTQALSCEPLDVNDPGRETARKDAREKLWRVARERLTENQFAALYLHAVEDMSIAEMARTLKKTQTHVKVLLHRARKRMVAAVADGNEELTAVRDTAREACNGTVIGVAQAEMSL